MVTSFLRGGSAVGTLSGAGPAIKGDSTALTGRGPGLRTFNRMNTACYDGVHGRDNSTYGIFRRRLVVLPTPRSSSHRIDRAARDQGEEREYLVLRIDQGDLVVRVPSDNVDLVGVRDVVNSEGLEQVFSVLRQPYTEEPTNWSRRYKANVEKLASGDVIKVAEVVRDLWRRDQDRGLSAGEAHAVAGTSNPGQRVGPGRTDQRGQGRDHP